MAFLFFANKREYRGQVQNCRRDKVNKTVQNRPTQDRSSESTRFLSRKTKGNPDCADLSLEHISASWAIIPTDSSVSTIMTFALYSFNPHRNMIGH